MSKKYKVSLILNILIVVMVLFATIAMFTGFKFMNSKDIVLTKSNIEMFKFYTVDSNLFMGIVSLIFIIFLLRKKNIPKLIYIFKLSATIGVMLTFLTTAIYLAPYAKYGYFSVFTNSNLFFHFLVPAVSFISFVFFEKTNKLNFKECLIVVIPTIIYALCYVINILMHLENGKVIAKYDFYGFANGGVIGIVIVFIFMILVTFVIGFVLRYLNRRNYEE